MAAFLLAALAARPLVRLNLLIYRKAGFSRLAATWERRQRVCIPAVRVVAAGLGLALLVLEWSGMR